MLKYYKLNKKKIIIFYLMLYKINNYKLFIDYNNISYNYLLI